MKDHNHDLIQELSEKLDSLWRYDEYVQNVDKGGGCATCSSLWETLKKEDQKHIELLRNEIARHVKEDRFD